MCSRLLDELDGYMQTVFCSGSINIENEEQKEVFLWGLRIKRYGEHNTFVADLEASEIQRFYVGSRFVELHCCTMLYCCIMNIKNNY